MLIPTGSDRTATFYTFGVHVDSQTAGFSRDDLRCTLRQWEYGEISTCDTMRSLHACRVFAASTPLVTSTRRPVSDVNRTVSEGLAATYLRIRFSPKPDRTDAPTSIPNQHARPSPQLPRLAALPDYPAIVTTASGLDIQQLHTDADRDGITKLVVGAIVHADGQVLILRRSAEDAFMAGIEELPSGGVEPGENLLSALERELAEEIGWTGPLTLDPGFVAHFDYISGSGRKARQYTFGLAHHGRSIVLSTEHTAYRWLHPAALTHSDVTDETAKAIRTWAAF